MQTLEGEGCSWTELGDASHQQSQPNQRLESHFLHFPGTLPGLWPVLKRPPRLFGHITSNHANVYISERVLKQATGSKELD